MAENSVAFPGVRPRGRTRPIRGRRAASDPGSLQQMRAGRQARRGEVIAIAARAALADGALTHESVARRSGVPLGYLVWAYPCPEHLLDADRPAAGRHGPPGQP